MYLKKIYIQGFKSFAHRTEIEFNHEITGIIGPNGSGKSNISDAIRWVLGEQSVKSLRGHKMEDIIFSGTDNKKALGFAEVSIVFDNKDEQIPIDYSEVSITRRMFRSGESEYFINKNYCRLKDIRELIVDTGIGKEGYSIIGQGRIDEILSNKPVDRRGIFEEAAGIVKFKNKKIESERKLEKTENNILRIKDLIHEVEHQKKQVEKEAKRTEKFNKLFVKLKELEVNKFVKDIRRIEIELDKLNAQENKLNEEIEEFNSSKKFIEDRYNELKEEIKLKEEAIEKSRNVKFTAIQDFEKNKNQLSILTERENHLGNEIKRLEDYNFDIKENIKSLDEKKASMNGALRQLSVKLEEDLSESKSREKELQVLRDEIQVLESRLDEKKNEMLNIYNKVSHKKSEMNSSVNFIDTIDHRLKEIKNEYDEIKLAKEKATGDAEVISKRLKTLSSYIEDNREKLNNIDGIYQELYNELENVKEKLNGSKIKLNGLNSSFNLITNMENEYDGYYNSVKRFLKMVKKDDGLQDGYVGVVADLIQVKDIYVKAIEVSLGASAQNIVVENERDAKNMIASLKKNKVGRITFLPKNTVRGNTITLNQSIKEKYNILGLAYELVDYNQSNDSIIRYLLGRILVIKDIDSAIKYSKESNYKYKVVTLDGEVFNPGGSITGGSIGDNRISILNRKNKLKSLSKDIDEENNNLNSIQMLKEELESKLTDVGEERRNIQQDLEELNINYANASNELKSNNDYIGRLKQDFDRKEKEIETLIFEYENLLENKSEIINSINDLEEAEIKLKSEVEGKNRVLKEERERLSLLEREHTNLTIKINSLMNEENNLNTKLKEIMEEEIHQHRILEKNSKEIDGIQSEINALEEKKEKIKESQKIHDEEEERLSNDLSELIKEKDVLMETFYEEQDNLKIINDRLSKLEKNLNAIQVKIARYEVENENIRSKLLEEYELNFNQALKYEKDLTDYKDIKARIKELKEDIKALGNVNINALEEFKNINERYEFMTKQYQDLIESKKDLTVVIKDMDQNMKTQFIKNFNVINENFKEVFSILFDGGFAKLELENEENVLESGIDIKVQPPGKKLQYLNLLSGGEKSLTAVALLFAILRTKPSPFCVLDEIDAALDESNINRYIKYLKNFSEYTQFILITHRKTTMEIADVLYGVTMEEQGISKLISVKLKDEVMAS